MPKLLSDADVAAFWPDGYHFPVPALTTNEVKCCRGPLEACCAPTRFLSGRSWSCSPSTWWRWQCRCSAWGRAVKEIRAVKRAALALAAMAALGTAPFALGEYRTTLLLPLFGYGAALLGLNLLLGSGGLVPFCHAMFEAIGAYAAAVTISVWRIESFEAALLAAASIGFLVAVPAGALCARYTRIFFGMLTLAFGMLFHSFVFKFYALTGSNRGMRVPRPTLLSLEFEEPDKTEFLVGLYCWYCLALAALLALLM